MLIYLKSAKSFSTIFYFSNFEISFPYPANYAYYGDDKNGIWRHDLNKPTNKLNQMISGLKSIFDMTSDNNFLYIVQYSQ